MVFVCAEIGINHQGSTEMAIDLLKECKKTRCDYAKIQTYKPGSRVSPTAKSAKYADKTLSMEETIYEMFERLRSKDWGKLDLDRNVHKYIK